MMLREENTAPVSHTCSCLLTPASYLLPSGICCPQFYLYIVSTHSKLQQCSRLLANCSQTTLGALSYCNKTTRHRARQAGWALSDTQTENTFQPI